MRVSFLINSKMIFNELKEFEDIKRILKHPYYFYKTFPTLENKSTEDIINYFKLNKESILKKLKKNKEKIERVWKPFEKKFFEDIINLTNFEWKFKTYKCFLSCAWAGRYFFPKNEIEVFGFLKDVDTLNTIAEELFHLHFWNGMELIGIDVKFLGNVCYSEKEKELWFFSEAVVGFVLPEIGFYKNYEWFTPWWEADPKIKEIYYNLKPLWDNRKNFQDFLERSIKVIM